MTSPFARRLAEKIAIWAHGLKHREIAQGRSEVYATLIDTELTKVREAIARTTNGLTYTASCKCNYCNLQRTAADLTPTSAAGE